MKKSSSQPLPDIEEDGKFIDSLRPLASKVLSNKPNDGDSSQVAPEAPAPPAVNQYETRRAAIASRRDGIEAKRGPRRRYEFVLPLRVGDALASEARKNGVSATLKLLQVLRDSGYPVIEEDFLDLRLERSPK